jgi:Domain of unknown function (DUF5134)
MGDHPGVITDLLAVLMLSVAVYCIGRLVLSLRSRWTTQRETDAVHTVMGVSMAGMLVPSLSALPSGLWLLIFSGTTLWFGWHVVRESDREFVGGRAAGQHVPHLLMSAAMVYMLIVVEWTGSMGTPHGSAMLGMSAASMGAVRWPLLTVVIAVLLLGDGVLTFGLNVGHGVPARPQGVLAMARVGESEGGLGDVVRESPGDLDVRDGTPAAARQLAPRSVMVCQLVMSLVMGYMLLTLL